MLTRVPRVRLWTYQALTVDNSADRTDGKIRTSYGRLNPAGSGRQPSGMKHANQQSVARFNLRNRTNRRSRPCVGLERAVICTAPLKAWQTTERGLRQSRTPHARSSCIIGNFLTIAWGTETLAIGDSQVRSYDRRTVSVEVVCAARKLQALYHKRPTDGTAPRTVDCSVERGSQWRCKDRCFTFNVRRFQAFSSNFEFSWGRPRTKHLNTKHPTVNRFDLLPRQAGCEPTASPANSREGQTYGLVDKAGDMRLLSHCRA